MRILVIGSGGREHALCWKIAASPLCDQLYCAPGNAGIAAIAECVPIGVEDFDRLVHTGLPECGDLMIAVKERATVEGNPGVVIAFTVTLPDGTRKPVQAVTTLRNMLTVLGGLTGYAERIGRKDLLR